LTPSARFHRYGPALSRPHSQSKLLGRVRERDRRAEIGIVVDENVAVDVEVIGRFGLVSLLRAYPRLLVQERVWWWPQTNRNFVIFFTQKTVQAFLIVGVFACGGRCLGTYFATKA